MPEVRAAGASRAFVSAIFKPVPGGYVYCAPDRVFGRSRGYLVNDAQKAVITAIMTPRRPILWQSMLWLVFSLIMVASALLVWAYTGHDDPTSLDVVVIAVLAAVEAAIGLALLRAWRLRRLRPVLAGLPPSDERITRSDVLQALKASGDAVSNKQLLLQGATGVVASLAFLSNTVLQMTIRHGSLWQALMWLAGAIVFGFVSAKAFMQLRSRSKQSS